MWVLKLAGWAEVDEGPGAVSSEQRAVDVGGRGIAVAGMGGIQRRRPVLGQRRLVDRRHQHQRLRGHEFARVDTHGCVGVR